MDPGNVVECNTLRRHLGLEEHNLFETECLVWRRIPSHAIIARWTWRQIRDTLGELFPPLVKGKFTVRDGMHYRPLQELRDSLAALPPVRIHGLVRVLTDEFDLARAEMFVKQLVLIMGGWRRGLSTVAHYPTLESEMNAAVPSAEEHLDYRLYAKSCEWRLNRALELARGGVTQPLNQLKSDLAASRTWIPPPFEEWKDERLKREQVRWARRASVPKEKSLVWVLQNAGHAVPMAPAFRRTTAVESPATLDSPRYIF